MGTDEKERGKEQYNKRQLPNLFVFHLLCLEVGVFHSSLPEPSSGKFAPSLSSFIQSLCIFREMQGYGSLLWVETLWFNLIPFFSNHFLFWEEAEFVFVIYSLSTHNCYKLWSLRSPGSRKTKRDRLTNR